MLRELSVLAMLGICSMEDIKNRNIYIWWPVCFAAEGILCWIFLWKQPAEEFLMGMFPGAVILILAFISRGNIGTGDGMLLIVTGIFLGAASVARILIFSTFISAGYALYLYTVKKKGKDYELPFVPFILIAFIGELLWRMQ